MIRIPRGIFDSDVYIVRAMRSQRIFDQVLHNPMPPLRRTWTLERSILQPVSPAGIFRALEESILNDRMILIELLSIAHISPAI